MTEKVSRTARATLRIALWVALVASAAAVLFLQPSIVEQTRSGALPPEYVLVAPGIFCLFVLVLAVDIGLRFRDESVSGRHLFQLAAAVVFVALLVPGTMREYRARKHPPNASSAALTALWQSRDARVRSLVVEVAGTRGAPRAEVASILTSGLTDADPMVRDATVTATQRLLGNRGDSPSTTELEAQLKHWAAAQ